MEVLSPLKGFHRQAVGSQHAAYLGMAKNSSQAPSEKRQMEPRTSLPQQRSGAEQIGVTDAAPRSCSQRG